MPDGSAKPRRREIAAWLPQPPARRRLSREQAAAYCGISPTLFDEEVKEGRYPKAITKGKKGGRKLWDLKQLDQALDSEIGLSGPSPADDPFLTGVRKLGDRRAARG